MPVEDIDFLTKNSEKDSYLFFVDSTQRDKETYPTVSEYTVTFTEPFSNVYGLEVLDAMIPSTKYTIDNKRDTLSYHVALLNQAIFVDDDAWRGVFHNLYSTTSFASCIEVTKPEINGQYNFVTAFVQDTVVLSAMDYDEKSPYKACEITKLHFLPDVDVSMNAEGGHTSDTQYKNGDGTTYAISQAFISNNVDLEAYLQRHDVYIDWATSTLWAVHLRGITLEAYHTLNQTTLGPGGSYIYLNNNIWFTISNVEEKLEHGNYDIFTFQTYLNMVIPNRHSYVYNSVTYYMPYNDPGTSLPNVLQNTVYGSVERQSRYKFTHMTPNTRFYFNLSKTDIASAIGFSSKAPSKGATLYYKTMMDWPNKTHTVVSSVFHNNEYKVLTPGIINLNGLSYVILRCPEIESHMYNSFSYSQNCPGIGMFKLGALNQIINVRFDFVNFIKKPFHPIGKLPKITLRFETTDGDLYDFKGIDHNMLLSVKFYVPRLKDPKHKYLLNPNYNPNFLEYMIGDMRKDDEQNDEEAEWDTGLEDKQTILRRKYERLIHEQNEYDYSSEDENDDFELGDNETRVDANQKLHNFF